MEPAPEPPRKKKRLRDSRRLFDEARKAVLAEPESVEKADG